MELIKFGQSKAAKRLAVIVLSMALAPMASAGVLLEDKGPGDWEILFTPYLWGTDLEGTSTVGDLPPLDIDASFGDIVSNLNIALSAHTEFHRGDWAFVFDPTYLSLEIDVTTPIPGASSPEVDVDIWLVEAWTAYKVTSNWEVLGGARWQDQDLDVKGLPAPPFPSSPGVTDSWLDWFAGVRFNYPLGQKWDVAVRTDFVVAGDSERTTNAIVLIHRRIGKSMSIDFGYRYFKDDYENSPKYAWDIKQKGPILGYSWAF